MVRGPPRRQRSAARRVARTSPSADRIPEAGRSSIHKTGRSSIQSPGRFPAPTARSPAGRPPRRPAMRGPRRSAMPVAGRPAGHAAARTFVRTPRRFSMRRCDTFMPPPLRRGAGRPPDLPGRSRPRDGFGRGGTPPPGDAPGWGVSSSRRALGPRKSSEKVLKQLGSSVLVAHSSAF